MNSLKKVIIFILFIFSVLNGYLLYFPFDLDKEVTIYLFLVRLFVSLSAASIYIYILYLIGEIFSRFIDIKLEKSSYFLISFFLGASIICFSTLILGILGILTYFNVFLVLLIALTCSLIFKKSVEFIPSKINENIWLRLALIPFICIAFFQSALPEMDWDSSVYHIPAVREFIKNHVISIYPENEPFNFPMVHNLLYYPLLYFKLDSGVRFFNTLILILGIKVLFQFAKVTLRKPYHLFATFIFYVSYFLWENIATARVEVPLTCYVLSYFLIKYYSFRKKSENLFYLSLVILGVVASIKSTGLIFAGIEFLVVLFTSKSYRTRSNLIFKTVCLIFLIFPSLYWYGKNQLAFNNFNYPKSGLLSRDPNVNEFEGMLVNTNKFFSRNYPKYTKSESTNVFAQDLALVIDKEVEKPKYDYSLWGLITNPQIYSYHKKGYINYLYLIALIPIFSGYFRYYLPFILTFILIFMKAHLIRYMIPISGCFAFFSAYNLSRFEIKKYRKYYLLLFFVLAVFIYKNQFKNAIRTINMSSSIGYYLYSGESSLRFLTEFSYSKSTKSSYLIQRINKLIPTNEKVLMIGENKTLYLDHDVISDQDQLSRQAIPWLRLIDETYGNQKYIYDKLKAKGINYIAINLAYYQYHIGMARFYEDYDIRLGKLDRCHPKLLVKTLLHLSEFISIYTKPVLVDNGNNIYIYKLL